MSTVEVRLSPVRLLHQDAQPGEVLLIFHPFMTRTMERDFSGVTGVERYVLVVALGERS